MLRSHRQSGDLPKAEQIGRLRERGAVDPFLGSVPSFPVCMEGGKYGIRFRCEAFRVLDDRFLRDRDIYSQALRP